MLEFLRSLRPAKRGKDYPIDHLDPGTITRDEDGSTSVYIGTLHPGQSARIDLETGKVEKFYPEDEDA